MNYIQIVFQVNDQALKDILIADLAACEYEGFEETEDNLLAYIATDKYNAADIDEIAARHSLAYQKTDIAPQNWNAVWEENFQPVIIDDYCTIRADFHDISVTTEHEIVITPKMSFGTGHHATTASVIRLMRNMEMRDMKVLDFGTGTGILAILANMKGASDVLAIDNDEWSIENTAENIDRNKCNNIRVQLGSLDVTSGQQFDIILANINRNILLQYMRQMSEQLANGGRLLISGFYTEDITALSEEAGKWNLKKILSETKDNWVALLFEK